MLVSCVLLVFEWNDTGFYLAAFTADHVKKDHLSWPGFLGEELELPRSSDATDVTFDSRRTDDDVANFNVALVLGFICDRSYFDAT